jgi:nitrous oxidase accessory protein NosD
MTALGVLTLSVWFVAEGTQLFSRDLPTPHHEQQEEIPVITVCPQGPPVCQFAKIQEAINAAQEPQSPLYEPTAEIRIAPGTYEENLQLIHKVVLLKGTGKDQVFLRPAHKHQPTILIVGAIGGAVALIEGVTIDGIVALAGLGSGAHIRGTRLRGMIFITGSVSSGLFEENEFQRNEFCGLSAIGVGRIQILRNTFQDGCDIRIEQARLYIPGVGPFQQAGDRVLIEGNQGGEISIWDGSAIAIRKNVVYDITLRKVESALIEENEVRHGLGGIAVEGSTDVVIQKNVIEENYYGISVMGGYADRRTSVAILGNRVVRNNYGIVTESLEYVTVCQGNEVKENQAGDYVVGWPAQPSPELKQKCEGS